MAKLISQVGTVINRMQSAGKVTFVSKEQSAAINKELADVFTKAKGEAEAIQRSSKAFIERREVGRIRK